MTGTISCIISMTVTFEPNERKKACELDADHAASNNTEAFGHFFQRKHAGGIEDRRVVLYAGDRRHDGGSACRHNDVVGLECEGLLRARIQQDGVHARKSSLSAQDFDSAFGEGEFQPTAQT